MKYFSMFTGVGGFELGLEGHECVGVSEIDKHCNLLLSTKFGVKNYGDATKINTDELPDFDMLCGGFPCQAFSIAGRREGFNDTRGTLFFEVSRIIKAKRPKIVFLENVKGLLNHDQGKTFRVIIQTLSELGYDVQWMVLNSKFFGVPQNRERVFIIGNLRGEPRPEILPFRENAGTIQGVSKTQEVSPIYREDGERTPEAHRIYDTSGVSPVVKTQISVYDTQDSKPEIGQAMRRYGTNGIAPPLNNWSPIITQERKEFREHKTDGEVPTLKQRMGTGGNNVPMVIATRKRDRDLPREQRNNDGYGQQFEPRKDGVTNTISSFDKDNYIAQGNLRRLTPRECERLQGFPDDWTAGFSDTQRYKMMGNAVTVNVIRSIGGKLK